MFVKKVLPSLALSGLFLMGTPGRASADWLLTPFIGANFGGNADFGSFDDFDDEFERRVDMGASLGWMGGGIVGFEVDFGWSPNFFENTVGPGNFEFGDSNVTTLMGNVLVGIPVGGQTGPGVRPYATGGIGLIRGHIDGDEFFNDLDSNNLGFNVGAGLNGFFTDNIGIRGDIRYFRTLSETEADDAFDLALSDFDFWRATVGLTIRFGGS
ncbi:MAG TPA: outer membrane beta-barrel protein [Vicinamibacterales bacterium]|nr:outer membrane beta-barrel protein [Vicinamibacterales bacterium]